MANQRNYPGYSIRRLEECKLPGECEEKRRTVNCSWLATIPQASPEFGVIRSFLDTVAELPSEQINQRMS